MKPISTPITCADGFAMSVQASAFHYSIPREDYPTTPYTHVEVGYPSAEEPELMPYAEDASKPTETVYAYVPVEVVNAIIARHNQTERK